MPNIATLTQCLPRDTFLSPLLVSLCKISAKSVKQFWRRWDRGRHTNSKLNVVHYRGLGNKSRVIIMLLVYLLPVPAGLHTSQCSVPVLHLLSGLQWGLYPCRGDTLPPLDKCEIWQGGGRSRVPNFTFIRSEIWEYSIAPKLSIFGILPINFPLGGDSFAQFLWNSRRLYASIGSFQVLNVVAFRDIQPSYRHFSMVGAFTHKFSIARSKNWHGPPLSPYQVWWAPCVVCRL